MQRFGQILRLREGAAEEYERYHEKVWPEVMEAIKRSGIMNFTIFRYDRWLFSYYELPDDISIEEAGKVLAACETCQKWEELMHNYQEPLPESSGSVWWVPMKESWRLPE